MAGGSHGCSRVGAVPGISAFPLSTWSPSVLQIWALLRLWRAPGACSRGRWSSGFRRWGLAWVASPADRVPASLFLVFCDRPTGAARGWMLDVAGALDLRGWAVERRVHLRTNSCCMLCFYPAFPHAIAPSVPCAVANIPTARIPAQNLSSFRVDLGLFF